MSTITIEVPDELSHLVAEAGDRLPELLAQTLQQPALPAHVYRYVLDFLASNPSAEQVSSFAPTSEMIERQRTLVAREADDKITPAEKAELDEYERLEHLMVMIKSGNLPATWPMHRESSDVSGTETNFFSSANLQT